MWAATGRHPGPPVPIPKNARVKAAPPATAAVPSAAAPVRNRRRPALGGGWNRRGTITIAATNSTTISPMARIRPPTAWLAPGTRPWSVSPSGKPLGASPMKES